MEKIDAHCHAGFGVEKTMDPVKLLSIMDKCQTKYAVIVPVDQYIAVYNEEGNDYIYSLMKAYPDRFGGFAAINPWYLDKGEKMLVKYLELGFSGLKLHPKMQGFKIFDKIVFPLIDICSQYNVPVYIHTGTMVSSEPFQLVELAGEYPEVNFIMGHSGNTDFWTDVAFSAQAAKNIYFETSHNLSSAIMSLIKNAGEDRVIFGSNMPRSHLEHEINKVEELNLSEVSKRKIYFSNIMKLLEGRKK